jgi:uncharacterized membrane protein
MKSKWQYATASFLFVVHCLHVILCKLKLSMPVLLLTQTSVWNVNLQDYIPFVPYTGRYVIDCPPHFILFIVRFLQCGGNE